MWGHAGMSTGLGKGMHDDAGDGVSVGAGAGAGVGPGAAADVVVGPLWRQAIERAVQLVWARVVEGVSRVIADAADVVDALTDLDNPGRVPGRVRGRGSGRSSGRVSDGDAVGFIVATLVLGSIVLGVLLAMGAGLVGLVGVVRDASVWAVVGGWHGFADGVDWLASGPGAPVTAYLGEHSRGLPWTGEQLLLGWATTGLVLWGLAVSAVRAAQLAWPLYVVATAAMAYQGTTGPSAPVVAGIVAVAGLVLAVPALRRGADTNTRVVVAAPAPVSAAGPAARPADTLPVPTNLTSATPS